MKDSLTLLLGAVVGVEHPDRLVLVEVGIHQSLGFHRYFI